MKNAHHTPLVSIIMPSLNQANFIARSIDSILAQDYRYLELIIMDGVSSDDTLKQLKHYQKKDRRVRWFSEPDKGPADALNKALRKTRGTLIGWLNADDCYTQGAVYRAVEAFAKQPEKLMVYGKGQHINQRDEIIGDYPTKLPENFQKNFKKGCFICQPTVFFQRSMFIMLGSLNENLKTAFDFDYWLRAFSAFPKRVGYLPEVQAYSRLHTDCITLRMRRTVAFEGMQLLAQYFDTAPRHWLLSYINEWLNEESEKSTQYIHNSHKESNVNLHISQAIQDARPYLSYDDYQQLQFEIWQEILPQWLQKRNLENSNRLISKN
ncbi:MAG TPA: glycosyltransferase [Thiothrix sp.]|nr:glycosyltransferase [Thiothrix sp.]